MNDEAKESSLEYNFRQKLQTRAHILGRSMFPKKRSGDPIRVIPEKLMESMFSIKKKRMGGLLR